jgi:hypothetical protein
MHVFHLKVKRTRFLQLSPIMSPHKGKGKGKEISSPISYIKSHASLSQFNSREFLELLNFDDPELANIEITRILQKMLSFTNINKELESFVGTLLTDKKKIFSDSKAKSYWSDKGQAAKFMENAYRQVNMHNMATSSALKMASEVRNANLYC